MRGLTRACRLMMVVLTMGGAAMSCGGAGDSDPTNPDSEAGITYTVTPSTLLLAPTQSGTIVVGITRSTAFKGDLTLSLGGLFGDVTGTFSPPSLSEGTTSTTLTITPGTSGNNFGTMSLGVQPSLGGKRVNINGTAPSLAVTVSIRPTLVMTKAGNGSGTVTSSPAGINCGTVCTGTFLFAPVTLTATPANGSNFTGWSGVCTGTTLTCTFTPHTTSSSNFNFATVTFGVTNQAITTGLSP